MKKQLLKIISLNMSIILVLLTLCSCNIIIDKGNQNNANGNTNNGSSGSTHFIGVKTLYSYEDVMDALAIVRQRRDVEPTYTVKDMGEDYTIFYQFMEYHYNRPYPIDSHEFFTSKSSGFFFTCIFLENQTCYLENHQNSHSGELIKFYKEDEDYEKLRYYAKNKACIKVTRYDNNNFDYFEEIEYADNLSYYRSSIPDQFEYIVRHCGIPIMRLDSCIELDDAFFELLFENVVTTSVKE